MGNQKLLPSDEEMGGVRLQKIDCIAEREKSPRVHKRKKITAKKSGEIEEKFGKDEEHQAPTQFSPEEQGVWTFQGKDKSDRPGKWASTQLWQTWNPTAGLDQKVVPQASRVSHWSNNSHPTVHGLRRLGKVREPVQPAHRW